ncbi:MAG: hypothetical protein C0624_13305 [Desulfuromonas sp.]|nr:MAG: hypothetical protein C0624_13305 [Desulfuromonas sp.]
MCESAEKPVFLAIDLGTTSLAGRLFGTEGALGAAAQLGNSQVVFGGDIISRLEQARSGQGEHLRQLLTADIEKLVTQLAGDASGSVPSLAAAGNPAICHLLLNLPVDSLLFPPHKPLESLGRIVAPEETGLPFPLYLFPLVSGYLGGDLVACLYGLDNPARGTLLIDLGTNAEMALYTGGGWLATSVAAGPAFEGGGISCGMRAEAGAIVDVRLDGEQLQLETVGGGVPRGVCGSGLSAAVAAALDGGLLGSDGTLHDAAVVETNLSRYLVEDGGGRALQIYRDARTHLLLTQEDIRQFQLAKGAVLAGVRCLLERARMSEEEIPEVIVTGAFGHGIPQTVLKRVALLPEKMVDRVRFTPAGVLDGLQRFLLQEDGPEQIAAFVKQIKPYPLSGTPAFERAFLSALNF